MAALITFHVKARFCSFSLLKSYRLKVEKCGLDLCRIVLALNICRFFNLITHIYIYYTLGNS